METRNYFFKNNVKVTYSLQNMFFKLFELKYVKVKNINMLDICSAHSKALAHKKGIHNCFFHKSNI